MAIWEAHTWTGGTVQIEATEAIAAGDPVKLTTDGIAKAGDGEAIFGVAAADIGSGNLGNVWTQGVFKVTNSSAGSHVMGAKVVLAASGEIDAGSSSDPYCGVVVESDIATSGTGYVLLMSSAYSNETKA